MCTYNGERFLAEQLDSLLEQTRRPDQIVIRDDASSDGTWRILKKFEERATVLGIEVDLLRNPENLGYIRNFEGAMRQTSGDLIFLCDQDDIWYSDKLASYSAEFERRPDLGLLHSDARLVDDDGEDLGYNLFDSLEISWRERSLVHEGNAIRVLVCRNVATGATMAFRREVMLTALPVEDGWFHDEWLAIVAALTSRMDCRERPSIDYRQHGANQIGARRKTEEEKIAEASKPRQEAMWAVVDRTERLLRQAQARRLPLSAAMWQELRGRIRHERSRAGLSSTLPGRLPVIAREALRRRYWRYSLGLRSIVSDLRGK